MTTEIVRHEAPASLTEKMDWARAIASSNLLPRQYKDNPANLLFAVEYADALGVSRINAITSIHVIDGKPSASADLIASLVRRAGHKLRVLGDDTYAEAHLIRVDDPEFTYKVRWDLDKARVAGLLGKGVWKSYPGAMLRSRAITEVARMGASDALFGVIYSSEELGAQVDDEGDVVHQVTTARAGSGSERAREALGVPQTGGGEGSQAETSVAEGAAGSIPAGNPSPSSPQPEGITDAQTRKLGVAMRDAGLVGRDDALAYVASVIDRTIQSRNDLTKDEASRVIDALERLIASEQQTSEGDVVDAEIVEDQGKPFTPGVDADVVWAQIQEEGKKRGLTGGDLEDDVATFFSGMSSAEASGSELAEYLTDLQGRPEAGAA